MTVKVVDASALAAIFFAEPQFETVLERIAEHELFAPTLLPYEIANVCAKKTRAHPDAIVLARGALERFALMSIEMREVSPQDALETAMRFGLSAYDASYLWLARELDAELVTLDGKLEKAATAR